MHFGVESAECECPQSVLVQLFTALVLMGISWPIVLINYLTASPAAA